MVRAIIVTIVSQAAATWHDCSKCVSNGDCDGAFGWPSANGGYCGEAKDQGHCCVANKKDCHSCAPNGCEWECRGLGRGYSTGRCVADGSSCCECLRPGCEAREIKGYWAYKYTIATVTDESWTHGTSKSYSESESKTWSKSVTDAVTHGKLTKGGKHSKQSTVSNAHSLSLSDAHSEDWSSSDTHTFTVHFKMADRGNAAWHWKYDIDDSCGHSETTLTQEMAITDNEDTPPCCLPGLAEDAPYYSKCLDDDALIRSSSHCTVGKGRRRRSSQLNVNTGNLTTTVV